MPHLPPRRSAAPCRDDPGGSARHCDAASAMAGPRRLQQQQLGTNSEADELPLRSLTQAAGSGSPQRPLVQVAARRWRGMRSLRRPILRASCLAQLQAELVGRSPKMCASVSRQQAPLGGSGSSHQRSIPNQLLQLHNSITHIQHAPRTWEGNLMPPRDAACRRPYPAVVGSRPACAAPPRECVIPCSVDTHTLLTHPSPPPTTTMSRHRVPPGLQYRRVSE